MNKTLQTFGLAALLAGIAMQPTEAYGILKPRIKNSANNVNAYGVNVILFDEVITPNYVSRIIRKESSGNTKAIGTRGERGLMQLMPKTWVDESRRLCGEALSFDLAFDPVANKNVGTQYLRTIESYLSTKIEGWDKLTIEQKQDLIAAAYNGGMGNLWKKARWDVSKMPASVQFYVSQLAEWRTESGKP